MLSDEEQNELFRLVGYYTRTKLIDSTEQGLYFQKVLEFVDKLKEAENAALKLRCEKLAQQCLDLMDAQAWQPIETAPRDTLLWIGNAEKGWKELGILLTADKIERDDIVDIHTDELVTPGWHTYHDGHPEYDAYYVLCNDPTHWMTLPAPPTEEADQ